MGDRAQELVRKGARDIIPPVEGVVDAFYKEEGHFRFVGKTDGDINISVDVEGGEMLADIGGLIVQVKGQQPEVSDNRFAVYDRRGGVYAEFNILPASRFRLRFEYKR